jgi:hypothetical protein
VRVQRERLDFSRFPASRYAGHVLATVLLMPADAAFDGVPPLTGRESLATVGVPFVGSPPSGGC